MFKTISSSNKSADASAPQPTSTHFANTGETGADIFRGKNGDIAEFRRIEGVNCEIIETDEVIYIVVPEVEAADYSKTFAAVDGALDALEDSVHTLQQELSIVQGTEPPAPAAPFELPVSLAQISQLPIKDGYVIIGHEGKWELKSLQRMLTNVHDRITHEAQSRHELATITRKLAAQCAAADKRLASFKKNTIIAACALTVAIILIGIFS